ncbi:MAG: trehalase-like domain-containing protein [Geodermatophilaceae bacterium]
MSRARSTEIAGLAFLSDCQTSALVDGHGSITWMCPPRFDSRSVFGALLDPAAGHWQLGAAGLSETTREYVEDTLVLETTFQTPSGRAVLTDALLVGQGERGHDLGRRSPHVLVRSLAVVEGQFTAVSSLCPRGDFGRSAPVWSTTGSALTATVGAAELTLCGPPPDKVDAPGAHWRRDLVAGQRLTFTLLFGSEQQSSAVWSEAHALASVLETTKAWQSWSALHVGFGGPWSEQVRFSGRVLQGLTFAPTGAVISAPTTSLPRAGAGGPTHDGRYASVRGVDAVTCAQLAATCAHEAIRTIGWLVDSAAEVFSEHGLQEVFGVGGETDLSERSGRSWTAGARAGPCTSATTGGDAATSPRPASCCRPWRGCTSCRRRRRDFSGRYLPLRPTTVSRSRPAGTPPGTPSCDGSLWTVPPRSSPGPRRRPGRPRRRDPSKRS